MVFKPRNNNNVVLLHDKIQNKKKQAQEDRYHLTVSSIDAKMQQPHWQLLAFDDEELEVMANFGETIKFPHPNTALRVTAVLSQFLLKHREVFSYE